MPLQRYLRNLIWVTLFPVLVVAGYLAYDKIDTLKSATEEEAYILAENITVNIDRTLTEQINVLKVMAMSWHLDSDDELETFYQLARNAHGVLGRHIILADTSMQMLLNTRVPFGTALPRLPRPKGHAAAPAALLTGQPAVGDTFIGPIANRKMVAVVVPVIRQEKVVYLLISLVETDEYQAQLDKVTLPDHMAVGIFDSQGNTIGLRATDSITVDPGLPQDGRYRIAIQSDLAPWSIAVHVPRSALADAIGTTVLAVGFMIVIGLALSSMIGHRASRKLDVALNSLIEPDKPLTAGLVVAEIESVRKLLLKSIKERETAQLESQESQERFNNVIEQSQTGIYILKDSRLTFANPRFAEILGYGKKELIGVDPDDLIVPDDRPKFHTALSSLTNEREKSVRSTVRMYRKDGSELTMGIQQSRLVFDGDISLLGVTQDITERERVRLQIATYVDQLERSMLGTVSAISTMMDKRDPYTAGHQNRVGQIAAAIAGEMGLSEDVQKGLRLAGSIHDIGKISIPAEILSKPTRLSAVEFEIIKTHAQVGYEILSGVDFPWPVAEIVLQHHERLDGSGYPSHLKGDEILLEAKIMTVADVVEAIASHRPYRAALGIEVALNEIEKHAGKFYDPDVAAACLNLFREKHYELPK